MPACWTLEPNAASGGRAPTPLTAACHDGSPFLTIVCSGCAAALHVHESQLAGAPDGDEAAAMCHGCGELLTFPPRFFTGAFAALRAQGWLA